MFSQGDTNTNNNVQNKSFCLFCSSDATACQPLEPDEKKATDTRVNAADRNGCIKGKGHKRHRRARRSVVLHSWNSNTIPGAEFFKQFLTESMQLNY